MATKQPASNVKTVKEPGATDAAEQTEEQALEAQVNDTSGVELPKAEAPKLDLTDPVQLQKYVDEQVKLGIKAGLAQRAAAANPKRGPDLPDQSEINPDTIEREVLTKQGYVVPTPKPDARFQNLR